MLLHQYPDPVLRRKCQRVERFDEDLAAIAEQMFETMRENHGIGLAAPQAGMEIRVFVANVAGEEGGDEVFVNPEIISRSGTEVDEEGCLSFPGVFVKVHRAARITVRFQDLKGEVRETEAEGLRARCIQQEVDHLEGRLLMDMMSPVQRIANRRRLHELEQRFDEHSAETSAS
ncbi:MAG: peptide deformylase [Phycisphaerae bacterium]|nr:peptide deformylase [Phycisphaerae bacterium]